MRRWAKIYRPAKRDWIVVGSGSVGVPDLRSPPFDFAQGRLTRCATEGDPPVLQVDVVFQTEFSR